MSIHNQPLLALLAAAGVGAALASPVARIASEDDRIEAKVDAAVTAAMEEGAIPGVSLAVALGGDTLLAGGWGISNPDEGEQADADSLYRAGSMTEAFLVVAALQLAEEDELDLEAGIGTYLPQLELDEQVTVHQLLNHTSGLTPYSDYAAQQRRRGETPTFDDILAWLAEAPFDATPGSCHSHSVTNVLLLGLIVERLAKVPVPVALTQRVFARAGLEATIYCSDGPALEEDADFSYEDEGELVLEDAVPQPFGALGLCTSASDLVIWLRALVDGALLDSDSVEAIGTDHALEDGSATRHGYGFDLVRLEGFEALSCGGGMAGGRVHLAYYPEPDLTIAVLANTPDAPLGVLERRVARAVLDLPEPGVLDEPLEADQRARYHGSYFVGCSEYRVLSLGERLALAPPGGRAFALLYQGKELFVSELDPDVRVEFMVDGERIEGFYLEQRGSRIAAKRM